MAIGLPLSGKIWYWKEASYGGGESGTTYVVSDKVQDVRLDTGDMFVSLRSISQPTVCAFVSTTSDPVLHVEWILQQHTAQSLSELCIERTACDLDSLAFCIGASTCSTTADSWYYLKGCKCKTWNISASRGEQYVCTADFSVKSVATSGTMTGSQPAALGTVYGLFNNAGSITMTGVTAAAYITDSVEIKVDNNLTDYWNVGSNEKKQALPGQENVTGSCDISLDAGGAVHWGDVFGSKAITSIVVTTGLTGVNDIFTCNTCRFDNTSIDINMSGEGMMTSVPFTAKQVVIT